MTVETVSYQFLSSKIKKNIANLHSLGLWLKMDKTREIIRFQFPVASHLETPALLSQVTEEPLYE